MDSFRGRGDGVGLGRLSVVIPNHNYGRFLRAAISSALAVDWPDVEVIVVDDGSTDDSVRIVGEFGDAVTLLAQENAGPRVACNRGFAVSTGEAVIFLDSDDVLEPSIAREVDAVWRGGVTKVQVQMSVIGSDGEALGEVFPPFRSAYEPGEIRRWIDRTAAYPTPPGSGNVYAREFLTQLFPLGDQVGDATDSAVLAAAPYLGDVLTIAKPLVRYRRHGGNRSRLSEPDRFAAQVHRAYLRHLFALQVQGRSAAPEHLMPLFRGRHLLQLRIAAIRLTGRAPLPGDSRRRMCMDIVRGAAAPGPETGTARLVIALWCVAALAAPATLARLLIAARFDHQGRHRRHVLLRHLWPGAGAARGDVCSGGSGEPSRSALLRGRRS